MLNPKVSFHVDWTLQVTRKHDYSFTIRPKSAYDCKWFCSWWQPMPSVIHLSWFSLRLKSQIEDSICNPSFPGFTRPLSTLPFAIRDVHVDTPARGMGKAISAIFNYFCLLRIWPFSLLIFSVTLVRQGEISSYLTAAKYKNKTERLHSQGNLYFDIQDSFWPQGHCVYNKILVGFFRFTAKRGPYLPFHTRRRLAFRRVSSDTRNVTIW